VDDAEREVGGSSPTAPRCSSWLAMAWSPTRCWRWPQARSALLRPPRRPVWAWD